MMYDVCDDYIIILYYYYIIYIFLDLQYMIHVDMVS
jgi:hypothetical protein